MRLTEDQRHQIALLVIALATENDDAVPPIMFALGFASRKRDPRLALLMGHICFNRGPYPYDMNRLAPKLGMPINPSIATLYSYVSGGRFDTVSEFPSHLVMLQRCAMVLSGIAMELGAGRVSSAGMLKPEAIRWLKQTGFNP